MQCWVAKQLHAATAFIRSCQLVRTRPGRDFGPFALLPIAKPPRYADQSPLPNAHASYAHGEAGQHGALGEAKVVQAAEILQCKAMASPRRKSISPTSNRRPFFSGKRPCSWRSGQLSGAATGIWLCQVFTTGPRTRASLHSPSSQFLPHPELHGAPTAQLSGADHFLQMPVFLP